MIAMDPTIPVSQDTNTFGASNNSLAAQSGTAYITATDYQSNNQGGAITSYNIKTLDFKQDFSVNASLGQTISGTTETDITGATLTFNLAKNSNLVVLFNTAQRVNQSAGNTGNLTVRLEGNTNGGAYTEIARTINVSSLITDASIRTYSGFDMYTYGLGTRNIKLTAQMEGVSGTPSGYIYSYQLSYFILGS
jgi:hypothetical protein